MNIFTRKQKSDANKIDLTKPAHVMPDITINIPDADLDLIEKVVDMKNQGIERVGNVYNFEIYRVRKLIEGGLHGRS